MGQLRRAFELFEHKTQLMRLLDVSSQAEGVRIFIGGESQVVPFDDLSIVSANSFPRQASRPTSRRK